VSESAKNKHEVKARLPQRVYQVWRSEGVKGIGRRLLGRTSRKDGEGKSHDLYQKWIALYDTLTNDDRQVIVARIDRLEYKPLISVVMPVYNTEEVWLRRAIESVRGQLYSQWELCVADDCSPAPHVRQVLEEFSRKDERIRVVYRQDNGHISAASNSALQIATGEFVALLDHDDELAQHALYMVAEELNAFPEADLIYSDEDKINSAGDRVSPHFKTDWNPDLFYSLNFISHLGVYRRRILEETGGFREGYEGSQDYDLALRVTERIPEKNIRHIPHVLYHWRELPTSVGFDITAKDYAHENARRAIRSHFERTGKAVDVVAGYFIFHRAIYPIPEPPPLVSLIIAARDRVESLWPLVEGILERTDYEPVEVVIVARESSRAQSLDYLDRLNQNPRIKVLTCNDASSLSAIYDLGVREAKGSLIGFINSELTIISSDWLREMVSHALRPEVGAVGAKILSENNSIEHAGMILGIRGAAGHAFKDFPADSEGYLFRAQVIQNYSAVSGDCLVMRKEILTNLGGFDQENFSSVLSDVDFCLRIRRHGYRILWTPYAQLQRVSTTTTGTTDIIKTEFDKADEGRPKWDSLQSDPYYNPNLTLDSEDFSLAFPPRVNKPWESKETVVAENSLLMKRFIR
jgi:glycosyltransferase involved in cell wall biosynthesis